MSFEALLGETSLGRRLARLTEQAESLAERQVTAVILSPDTRPGWAQPLPDGRRVVRLEGGSETDQARVLDALLRGEAPAGVVVVEYLPAVSGFIVQAVEGPAAELLAVAPRGEGKSWGALGLILVHASVHAAENYPLPVRWLVVGSSLVQLKATVLRTMAAPDWASCWKVEDDGRLVRLVVDGACLAELDMIGVEDASGMDRLRREACCLWCDEPASVATAQAAGISDSAWATALSSLRLPTHHRAAVLTSNAPGSRHWAWRRFVTAPSPGCVVVHIPKGERTTPEQRAELERSMAGLPPYLRLRLLEGQAADAQLGAPVCQGFDVVRMTAPAPLEPVPGRPLYIGVDAGLTPVAVVGQHVDGHLRIYAGLALERGGTEQLVEEQLRPWLSARAPWALKRGADTIFCVDPSMASKAQDDVQRSPITALRRLLPGTVRKGPVQWPARKGPLLKLFNQAVAGRPVLEISPVEETELLREALSGGWHYPAAVTGEIRGENPVKSHPDSDLGDAFSYLVAELMPDPEREERLERLRNRPTQYAESSSAAAWRNRERTSW